MSDSPSAAGCSFVVNRQLHLYGEFPDGLVVSNPSDSLTANVEIYFIEEGGFEEELFESFSLAPEQSQTVELLSDFVAGTSSLLRTGGIFRMYSDIPIIGYQHAPLQANLGNESSLLLPDEVLGLSYVVFSYPGSLFTSASGMPSYFELVAIEDDTHVTWRPRVATASGGLPMLPQVPAGGEGSITLGRYDTLRITPSENDVEYLENWNLELDVSGTVITASRPIWVTGATRAAEVPRGNNGTGDQLQEVLIPLEHWGREYVATAPHSRGEQDFQHWRIFAGADDVTVYADPELPEFPVTLATQGEYFEFSMPPGLSVVLSSPSTSQGGGPFMPVQYLQSRNTEEFPNLLYGDSAMTQMVPTKQFLDRYVFATGTGFFYNFAHIVRAIGGPRVYVDGIAVADAEFVAVNGTYEVAELSVAEGAHVANSDDPFGVILDGFALGQPGDDRCAADLKLFCNSSYAYPGGLKAEIINIP